MIDRNPQGYASVQHWMEVVNGRYALSDTEWDERLDVLWRFCDSVGQDPDAVIKDALDERSSKLDYCVTCAAGPRIRRGARAPRTNCRTSCGASSSNNGARVLTKPYPDVYGSKGS